MVAAKRMIEQGAIVPEGAPVEQYLDDHRWLSLRPKGHPLGRIAVIFAKSSDDLKNEIREPHGLLYHADDSEQVSSITTNDQACPTLYRRKYRRNPILETKLEAHQIVALAEAESLLAESGQETFEGAFRVPEKTDFSPCPDEDASAPAIEYRLQRAFSCSGKPAYPTVCGVLQSRSLCALKRDRDAVRVAVATDRLGRLLREISTAAKWSPMLDTEEVLRRLPRSYGLDDVALQRIAQQLAHALARDIVRNFKDQGNVPILAAVAPFLKCKLAVKWGEAVEPRSVHDVAQELVANSVSEDIATHLFAVFASSSASSGSGQANLEHALAAFNLTWPSTIDQIPQVGALVHSSQAGDDAGVFSAAIEGEPDAEIKKALHALALATTRSLTLDRTEDLQLGTRIRERLYFGVAVGATVGVSYQPNTQDYWLPAPISLPLGMSYQNGVFYSGAGLFDVGQYLSSEPSGVRKPNGLDALSPSAAIGLRFGAGRVPLVLALTGGAARFLLNDATGFLGLNIGTFLPVATFVEE
jgi:hypothetical protein